MYAMCVPHMNQKSVYIYLKHCPQSDIPFQTYSTEPKEMCLARTFSYVACNGLLNRKTFRAPRTAPRFMAVVVAVAVSDQKVCPVYPTRLVWTRTLCPSESSCEVVVCDFFCCCLHWLKVTDSFDGKDK